MDDLFGLIVIIIGIAAGIYSDKKKENKRKRLCRISPAEEEKMYHRHRFLMVVMQEDRMFWRMRQMRCRENYLQDSRN